jgi:hypothetical protein
MPDHPSSRPDHLAPRPGSPLARLRTAAPVASVQGTLALDLVPEHSPPEPTAPPAAPGCDLGPVDLRTRRRLEAWARRYAQVACDVVAGLRPATQLVRWSTADVHADLARRALLVARAGRHRPGGRTTSPARPRVLSVRPSFLAEDVVEVAVHVAHGRRSRAVAARFEVREGHWVCVALDFA